MRIKENSKKHNIVKALISGEYTYKDIAKTYKTTSRYIKQVQDELVKFNNKYELIVPAKATIKSSFWFKTMLEVIQRASQDEKHPLYELHKGRAIYDAWLNDYTEFSRWSALNKYQVRKVVCLINKHGSFTPDNIKWVHNNYKADIGQMVLSGRDYRRKLTGYDNALILVAIQNGYSSRHIGKYFGVDHSIIARIATRAKTTDSDIAKLIMPQADIIDKMLEELRLEG